LLSRIGEFIIGYGWQSELARRLNVNTRTVQRWCSGEYQPHSGHWNDIAQMVRDHRNSLDQKAANLLRDITKLSAE
jgi:ribosome-binding protein aMBF1 (putative translation factor)